MEAEDDRVEVVDVWVAALRLVAIRLSCKLVFFSLGNFD